MSTIQTVRPAATRESSRPDQAAEFDLERADESDEQSGRPNRRWMWIAIVAAVGCVGAGYGLASLKGGHSSSEQAGHKPAAKSALGFREPGPAGASAASKKLETVPVEVVRRGGTLLVTGSLAADEQSNVASYVNGIVAEVRVDRGSVVRKGDVLVQLDPTDYKNKLAEGMAAADELKAKVSLDEKTGEFVAEDQPEVRLAKAVLGLATSRLRRAEALLPDKAIAADECDAIRAEFESATQRYRQSLLTARQNYQAYLSNVTRLAALRKMVADTTIVAPFDGLVVEKQVAVGEQVTGGFIASKIVTLVRTNPLRISLTVPQQNIGQIKPGQKVEFQVDTYPGRAFQAEVRYISPVVTSDTRSMVVEGLVPNPDGALRPGLFATAELELTQQRPELLVPASAVERMDEVARVFVVRDGVVREQVVALGKTVQDKVEIRSGLSGGEVLVARPDRAHDGDAMPAAVKR